MKHILLHSLFAVLLFSCVHSTDPLQNIATPKPTSLNAEVTGTPLPTLERGYGVYMRHCAQCHEHRLPTSAKLPAYHQTITTMSHVAGISKEEEEDLHTYLQQFTDR